MYSQYQPLKSAIKSGQIEVIKEFIKQDKNNINVKIDDDGNTLLHLAALSNQPHIVLFLLSHDNIEIEAKNKDEQSPFQLSIVSYERSLKELDKVYELQLSLLDNQGNPRKNKEQDYKIAQEYITTCETLLINITKIKSLLVAALKLQNNQSEFKVILTEEELVEDAPIIDETVNVDADEQKEEIEMTDEALSESESTEYDLSDYDSEDEYKARMNELMVFMNGYPGFTSVVTELKKNSEDIASVAEIAVKFNRKRSHVEAWKNRSRIDKKSDPKAKLVLAFTELFINYSKNSFQDIKFVDSLEDILIQLEFMQVNSEHVQQ